MKRVVTAYGLYRCTFAWIWMVVEHRTVFLVEVPYRQKVPEEKQLDFQPNFFISITITSLWSNTRVPAFHPLDHALLVGHKGLSLTFTMHCIFLALADLPSVPWTIVDLPPCQSGRSTSRHELLRVLWRPVHYSMKRLNQFFLNTFAGLNIGEWGLKMCVPKVKQVSFSKLAQLKNHNGVSIRNLGLPGAWGTR